MESYALPMLIVPACCLFSFRLLSLVVVTWVMPVRPDGTGKAGYDMFMIINPYRNTNYSQLTQNVIRLFSFNSRKKGQSKGQVKKGGYHEKKLTHQIMLCRNDPVLITD